MEDSHQTARCWDPKAFVCLHFCLQAGKRRDKLNAAKHCSRLAYLLMMKIVGYPYNYEVLGVTEQSSAGLEFGV